MERIIRRPAAGFTIIELLIATAVFATVLVIVTTGIIQFSRVYYKGVTEANTQNTARSVLDTVAQGIQFGGGSVTDTIASPAPGTSYNFCIGNNEYSYRPGYKLVDTAPGVNQTNHAMMVRTVSGCTGPSGGQDLSLSTVTGRELLSPNMRLSNMVVKHLTGDLYQVRVRIIFGDDTLLSNPTGTDASCKGDSGRQFCAVSDLSTIVIKRVE